MNPFFSFSARKKRTVSISQEKKEGKVRTVVLNLTQKISDSSCPSRLSLPPERSLRSAHRLSAELRQKISQQPAGPPSSRSRAARSCQRRGDLGRANQTGRMSCHMMAARFALPNLESFSFLFFTGRGDSFLSQRRERKEWGRKKAGDQWSPLRSSKIGRASCRERV